MQTLSPRPILALVYLNCLIRSIIRTDPNFILFMRYVSTAKTRTRRLACSSDDQTRPACPVPSPCS